MTDIETETETELHTEAPDETPTPTLAPPRRILHTVARWTAAVLVCGGLGTGTAFAVAGLDRGDVPGLATREDSRWDYPRLTLPALPAGSPRPLSEGNEGAVHHADLRKLLPLAPAGATQDKKLTGGWTTIEQYASAYAKNERAGIAQALRDDAVRHIAARGWTMPDGTTSRVQLLQFSSVAFADRFLDETIGVGSDQAIPLAEAPDVEPDDRWVRPPEAEEIRTYVYQERKPYGAQQVRQAYLQAGDTVALITHARKGGAEWVPFQQSVILQLQLLG